MKRFILIIHILLLATMQAVADDYYVTVGSTQLKVDVTQSGTTYTIGNGNNACIPHYQEGTLTIHRITSTSGDKNVVGMFAFRFCTGITKIVVEEGITSIEDFAFIGCSNVVGIELPTTLTSVGRGAFVGLPNLRYLECKGTTVPTWSRADVFSYEGTASSMVGDAKTRVLYVPEGYAGAYKSYKYNNKVGWADAFTRIYETHESLDKITSLDDLVTFRDDVNTGKWDGKMVTLTADIDLSGVENWEPIGSSVNPFNGIFNGDGHTIKNLKSSHPTNNYIGLFGYAKKATIYNMHIQNPKVSGSDYVGTVIGCAVEDSHITDILVTSNTSSDADYTVQTTNGSVGGIVGFAKNAVIERCMFLGKVRGAGWTGGIIGNVNDGVTITDCSASNFVQNSTTGYFTHVPYTGGIVGGAGKVTIERCFARNNVSYMITNPLVFPGYIVGGTNTQLLTTIKNCAYWKSGLLEMAANISDLKEEGNVGYNTEAEMNQDKTKSVLGEDKWYYFTGNYADYPVPITLIDMYLKDCVDKKDDNNLVYRPLDQTPTGYEVVRYEGNAKSLVIPDQYDGKPITAILPEAFKDNTTLISVTMGNYVTSIGKSAFENCDALTAVDLPDAVTFVGEDAFRRCDNLISFNIGTGFKDHDGNFLAYCPKLTTLTASRGNINDYQCVENVLIHNVGAYGSYLVACAPGKTGDYVIPIDKLNNDDVYILSNCFASCKGLTSITFPAGKQYDLGKGLFDEASNLYFVDISNVSNFKSDKHYTVDRFDKDQPFFGLNEQTLVYLPDGNNAKETESNILILNAEKTAATANSVLLADGWDFNPKVPVSATKGIDYRRDVNYTLQDAEEKYMAQGFTVYLPYALTLTNDNVKVYAPSTATTVDDVTTIIFKRVKDNAMEAYKPYYIIAEGDMTIDFSTTGETSIPAIPTEEPEAISGYRFKGTTVNIANDKLYDAERPTYILQDDGKWHKVPAGQTEIFVGPYRAYFQATTASTAEQLDMRLIEDLPFVVLDNAGDNTALLEQYDGQKVHVTNDRVFTASQQADDSWKPRAYTVCLPYDIDLTLLTDEDQDRVDIYEPFAFKDGEQLVFMKSGKQIHWGTPVIVVVNRGSIRLDSYDVILRKDLQEDGVIYEWDDDRQFDKVVGHWHGSYRKVSNDEAATMRAYVMQTDGKIKRIRNDEEKYCKAYMPPFRCYATFNEILQKNVLTVSYTKGGPGIDGDESEVSEFPADDFEADADFSGYDDDVETDVRTIRTIEADGSSRYFDMNGRYLGTQVPTQHGVYIRNNKIVVINKANVYQRPIEDR